MAKQHHIITLHIELSGIEPPIWRRIAVDGDISLRALHHIIQAAFGWSDSHLHEFRVEERTYSMLDNENVLEGGFDNDEEMFDDRKGKLNRLLYTGQRFTYLYDFGDSWSHAIRVESIETRPEPMGSAWIIDGKRACPPDDVGGIGGYENFVATLKDEPESQEAKDYLRWIGGSFDAELFDQRMANTTLDRMAWNGWGRK
jgi:hypothetical protein